MKYDKRLSFQHTIGDIVIFDPISEENYSWTIPPTKVQVKIIDIYDYMPMKMTYGIEYKVASIQYGDMQFQVYLDDLIPILYEK